MIGSRGWFLVAMVAAAAVSRVFPHPFNFTPVAAMALFAGATFRDRRAAWIAPLLALLVSDALLHWTYLRGYQSNWGFYRGQWVVYATMAATVGIGTWLRGRRTFGRIALATLAGSLMFFVVTNFAVWAGGSMYPKTAAGLTLCYEAAIPFFDRTVAGDALYSSILFGSLALIEAGIPTLRDGRKPTAVGLDA